MLLPGQDSGCQLLNGLPLVTTGFEWSVELERRHMDRINFLNLHAVRGGDSVAMDHHTIPGLDCRKTSM
jgi:hypothetical protein